MPIAEVTKRGDILRIREVAQILKYSPKYIVDLIDAGQLAALVCRNNKCRRTLRVTRSALEEFIAANQTTWAPRKQED